MHVDVSCQSRSVLLLRIAYAELAYMSGAKKLPAFVLYKILHLLFRISEYPISQTIISPISQFFICCRKTL